MLSFTSRGQPRPVPSDDVLPARFFDDSPMVKDVVMRWLVRFDEILDPEKLHSSLDALLKRKTWRRLGGRLRLNSKGKLEVHVPRVFDSERPSVRFSTVSFDTSINAHPLASQLPQPTDGPSIQIGGDSFRHLKARKSVPVTIEDYLHSDEPPLELQVFTFRDATIVTLNFPHVLTDAVGLSALIENWCRVLADRADEVVPLSEPDPLETIGTERGKGEVVDSHVLKPYMLTGWHFILFGIRFVLDLVFGPKMMTRTIFLPQKFVAAVKQKAIDDVQQGGRGDAKQSGSGAIDALSMPFLSNGDIITAWGTKLIARSFGSQCKRSMAIMNVFELRSRLPRAFDRSLAHVQNAFFVLTTILSVREAQELSLGQVALRLRSSTVQQTAEGQVEALVRAQRASIQKDKRPVVFARPDSILLPCSNWSKARFFDVVDFGPAVVKAGETTCGAGSEGGRKVAVGKPMFFLAFDANPKPNPTHRNVFNIIGSDPSGNYWITGMLSPATWAEVEKSMVNMSS